MIIAGKLVLRDMYTGSKSEGKVAFLITDGDKEYRLYRAEVYPINDKYFFSFDEKKISVDGEIKNEEYLLVSSIEEIQENSELE